MGHTIIGYHGKSGRSHDVFLMIFFRFMIKKARKQYSKNRALLEICRKWDDAIDWSAPGVVLIEIEEFLDANPEHLKIFLDLLDAVEEETEAYGEVIQKEYVNELFENKPTDHVGVGEDYPTKTQIDLIREFRNMIKSQK